MLIQLTAATAAPAAAPPFAKRSLVSQKQAPAKTAPALVRTVGMAIYEVNGARNSLHAVPGRRKTANTVSCVCDKANDIQTRKDRHTEMEG